MITSAEQRQKYKGEFNKNYSKYLKLHNKLDEVSKRFTHLETKLRQTPRGTEDFKVSQLLSLCTLENERFSDFMIV